MRSLMRGLSVLVGTAVAVCAQSTVPTLSQQMPARVLVAGGAALSIRLTDYFSVPSVTGTVAQFDTVSGKFNVELLANDAPKTVTNFLNYVNRGAYTNSLIHRAPNPDFVIQGGGYFLNGNTITPIAADPAVQNEFKVSNTRGMLAMAKTNAGPDTATSQWFVNVTNNTALDTTNGGFTVFGRVLGTGMTVVDGIAAIPIYDATADLGSAFGELPLLNPALTIPNLILVRSIKTLPVFPNVDKTGIVTFGGSLGASGVVSADITAGVLTIKPLAAGTTTVTVTATDTNENKAQSSFTVTVVAAPTFTTQPASQTLAAGASGTLTTVATGGTLQWQRNGGNLAGIDSATVNIPPMEPGLAGLYTVVATSGSASITSSPAILGISTSSKVVGTGTVVGTDIHHINGNTFDQILITGSAAAFTADYSADPALNQITRASYIDLDDDIVQIELGGPGTLAVTLDETTAAAPPTKYNQPSVSYVKGHASIVVTGADEHTNLTVFTVGRATAVDPTGGFNVLEPVSATNNPANNGSSLFVGHSGTVYDGIADVSRITISSTNGRFGGLRAANAHFYDIKGMTGVYAPGVTFDGPVYVGNINAYDSATPVLLLGGANGETRITGGNLLQNNGQPVKVSGVTQLKFTAGSDSHGNIFAAQRNLGLLHQNDQNVTSQIVVNPQ